MEKGIIYEPLYSVGKVKSREGKIITCAFCEQGIKSNQQEVVVYQEKQNSFYHVPCYQDYQKILTGEIFKISCGEEPKKVIKCQQCQEMIKEREIYFRTKTPLHKKCADNIFIKNIFDTY